MNPLQHRRPRRGLVAAAALLATLTAASALAQGRPVRIGMAYPLTGPIATNGIASRDGARLAFLEENMTVAGRKIADFLLARGVRSILMVTATLGIFNIRERLQGARERVAEHPETTLEVIEIGIDPGQGARALAEWLRTNPKPDAVVGLTNLTTLAALAAFAEVGLEAPKDLALVGFHDSLWMTARKNPVTTVVPPVDEVARMAWERLEQRMSGDTSPVRSIILSAELVQRASAG